MLMVWSLQANGFQCNVVSGGPFAGTVRTPIQMTNDPHGAFADGITTSDTGVKIEVSVRKMKKAGIWTEGSSPDGGVSLTLGIVNPESRLGSDTIASVSAEGIKNGLNSADLKLSALGRVTENSWIRVECRAD
jgi:hypothetical protein